MKYDDAEIYFLNFETDLPNENGGRHIALFIEWAIRRGLVSPKLMQQAEALRTGATTAVDVLFDQCDGKLMDADLNDEGNAFAAAYYDAHHMADFVAAMNLKSDATIDQTFGADFTAQRQRRVRWQLDRRYSDWRRQFGLPDKSALLERLLPAVQPVIERAGFARVENREWGSVVARATFERRGDWGVQQIVLDATDKPEWFYGLRLELTVHLPRVYEAILREKRADYLNVTGVQPSAVVSPRRIAEGWDGPVEDYAGDFGYWIFRDEDVAPLAAWLAARLRTFALPLLRGLDSVDALALSYGHKPVSASPIHRDRDPYPALVCAEMARHPRLGGIIAEIEASFPADPRQRMIEEQGASLLIARIRQRSKALIS